MNSVNGVLSGNRIACAPIPSGDGGGRHAHPRRHPPHHRESAEPYPFDYGAALKCELSQYIETEPAWPFTLEVGYEDAAISVACSGVRCNSRRRSIAGATDDAARARLSRA